MAKKKLWKVEPIGKKQVDYVVQEIRKVIDKHVKNINAVEKKWRAENVPKVKKALEKKYNAMLKELDKYERLGLKTFVKKLLGKTK